MISKTKIKAFAGCAVALTVFSSVCPARAMKPTEVSRLSVENDAKLTDSVAAHLSGVAQLQRVILKDLDWKAADNRERKHVQEAIKDFKNSQVLISEAMANNDLLLKRLDDKRRKKMEPLVQSLREKTGDLTSKNAAIIKMLESQQMPSTEALHDLTESMMGIIGLNLVAPKKK